MKKSFSLLSLLLSITILATACLPITATTQSSTNTPPTTPPSPVPTESSTALPTPTPHPSVFLISWDAGRADTVYGLMADGSLPNFAQIAAQGVRAEYAQTIDPSLTAAAHNSISSGSFPTHTGIVSNAYHDSSDAFYWYRRGFDEIMDNAEPIWVTASKAGLTTAAVFFVGGSPSHLGQQADYTIGYGKNDAYSRQVSVSLSAAADTAWADAPTSFSPPLTGKFNISGIGHVYLLVLDSSDDQQINYDQVILNTDQQTSGGTEALRVGDWSPLTLLKSTVAGADFLIQKISAEQVTIFHSGINHNTASPRALLNDLNQQFGFFPAGPDHYALEHGWITEEDYLHMLERFSTWSAEVAAWVYTTYHPDLLMTWQDNFDAAGHAFFLQDPRQQGYTPERAAQYAEYYRRAAEIADQALGIMLPAIDLQNTTLLMVADHGMAPIHSRVYINTVLEQAGLLTLDAQNNVINSQTQAFAVASGGAVNVYINLEGREGKGTVPPEKYAEVQAQIVDLLNNLTDPDSGEKVFQRVMRRDELSPLGLDHPHSGDVFAQANLGYHLDGWRGKDIIFEATSFYGQHGYDSSLPEMHAIFIAAGAAVPQSGAVIPPVRVVDYAPTIAQILGFSPASTVDGQIIPFSIP